MGDKNEQIKQALKDFVGKLPEPDLSEVPILFRGMIHSFLGESTLPEKLIEMLGEIPDSYVPLITDLAEKVTSIVHEEN